MDFHVKEGKKGLSATKSNEGKALCANIYHVPKDVKWIFATKSGEGKPFV